MLTADEDDLDDIAEIISEETELGNPIPESMKSPADVEQAVRNGELLRLTLYGDTIGASIGGELLIGSKYAAYLDEAAAKVAAGLD